MWPCSADSPRLRKGKQLGMNKWPVCPGHHPQTSLSALRPTQSWKALIWVGRVGGEVEWEGGRSLQRREMGSPLRMHKALLQRPVCLQVGKEDQADVSLP